jgi:hypothetical protein
MVMQGKLNKRQVRRLGYNKEIVDVCLGGIETYGRRVEVAFSQERRKEENQASAKLKI